MQQPATNPCPAKQDYMVDFNPFYHPWKSLFLGPKCALNITIWEMFGLKLNKYQ